MGYACFHALTQGKEVDAWCHRVVNIHVNNAEIHRVSFSSFDRSQHSLIDVSLVSVTIQSTQE
jgi:hypothetical protein